MNETIPFLETIINLFTKLKREREEKSDEYINALFLIEGAINHTLSHIQIRGYNPSNELAEIWLKAARSIHPFDNQISDMLVRKSHFWSSPEIWDFDQIIVTLNELMLIIEESRNFSRS